MIKSGSRTLEVPRIHSDVQLLDLLPPTTGRWRASESWHVTEVDEPSWMHVTQGELLQMQ